MSESSSSVATAIRTYRGGYGHTVLPTSTGVIMGGTYGAGFECCDPWLVWLDTHGNPLKKLVYDADELSGADNIQSTSDGGFIMAIDADGNVQYGDCGEVGDTFAEPFQTSAMVVSPTTRIIDKNIRVADISVNVIDQTYSIESCTPGE